MKKFILLLACVAFLLPGKLSAAKKDSIVPLLRPIHKNVIKWNVTPMMLWSTKNLTFSYERILNPKQSICIIVGYLEFPSIFKDTVANLVAINSRQKSGINVEVEYRFYLFQRNRRPTPDGVLIAPFASYYGYQFKNNFDILHTTLDSNGQIKGHINVINVGVELGYQFVFWKRLTLDLVLFGPSISYYKGGIDITGNINLTQIKDLNEDIYNRLLEKYPMIGDYVVNKSFSNNGKLDLFSIGFRYVIQIGFHF